MPKVKVIFILLHQFHPSIPLDQLSDINLLLALCSREEIALQPSGVTCFSCGQVGHKKAECPTHGSNRPIQCFRCRETGHHIKDCPRESADPVDFCLNCAREGHLALDCDQTVDLTAGRTGHCKIYLGKRAWTQAKKGSWYIR